MKATTDEHRSAQPQPITHLTVETLRALRKKMTNENDKWQFVVRTSDFYLSLFIFHWSLVIGHWSFD